MDKKEAVAFLESQRWAGKRTGRDRAAGLLALLGNPQNDLKFIHVAGSNGKGSTCAMLFYVLKEAGYRVGLFTSPYIEDFSERIRVGDELIGDHDIVRLTELIIPAAEKMDEPPSFFELVTAMAMLWYREMGCDIVVLETGLGGEFDSTNVIEPPLVSVITNIGIEHAEFLGNTIEEIAKAKAGIIKAKSPVICYDTDPAALSVIRNKCHECGCRLRVADSEKINHVSVDLSGMSFSHEVYGNLSLPLIGGHQLKNAAVSLLVIDELINQGYRISPEDIRRGLSKVHWPARFEVLGLDPLFILDGAHNPQCCRALADTLEQVLPERNITFITGLLGDKDYKEMLGMVVPLGKRMICLTPDSPRAMDKERLKALAMEMAPDMTVLTVDSVEEAIDMGISAGDPIVVFGSLYLAGEVRTAYVKRLKKEYRDICLQRIKSMTEAERSEASHRICQKLIDNEAVKNADIIFSYMATSREADLGEFHSWARKVGKRLAFPVCREGNNMDFYEPDGPESFVKGAFGIKEPDIKRSILIDKTEAGVMILPCVGFDKSGGRLGHGAGYYDRFLSGRSLCVRIGVAFECQRLDSIPVGVWDEKADIIIVG